MTRADIEAAIGARIEDLNRATAGITDRDQLAVAFETWKRRALRKAELLVATWERDDLRVEELRILRGVIADVTAARMPEARQGVSFGRVSVTRRV